MYSDVFGLCEVLFSSVNDCSDVVVFYCRFWSLVVFLVGSCICTGAQSMPVLLAGRGISGVGGAGITTVSRIIISDVRSLDENSVQASIMVSLQGLGYIIGEDALREEHIYSIS